MDEKIHAKEQHIRQGEQKMDKVNLLFLGAPLLDIMAHCGPETLDKYGLKLDDCVKSREEHEELFKAVFDDPKSRLSAGGSSQNTARAAKWTLGDKAQVAFSGCVGQDNFADSMSQRLVSEQVEPLYITLPGESTGVCVCFLNKEGHRSMCTRLGAAALYERHHFEEQHVQERLCRTHTVFVAGYFFVHCPEAAEELIKIISMNQLFAVSLSAEYICREHNKEILHVLPRIDVLFSNKAEAIAIAPSLGLENEATVEEVARELATRNRNRLVVVTQGPEPVVVVQGSGCPRYFPVAQGIKVLDSVGCGDAMAGAFLAVYTLTRDIEKAVKTGIAAAAEITQVTGCNPTQKKIYPLHEEVTFLEP